VVDISIFTTDGRLVSSQKYDSTENTLLLSFVELPSGLYYVNIRGENIKGTYKVMKR
jgi:hypothetical protein